MLKKLDKKGDVDPDNCATKIIICQAELKHPPKALHTSISVTPLKSQRTKLNSMGFARSVIPDLEVKRQRHERKKQAEEDFIGKMIDDIIPMTGGNDINPPTYKPGEDDGYNDSDFDDDNDIVPTPVSTT